VLSGTTHVGIVSHADLPAIGARFLDARIPDAGRAGSEQERLQA
jgi:hypothetical protein